MFTKGRPNGIDMPITPDPSLQSPRRQMPSRMVASIITSDVHIVGTVTSEGEIQIDGRIEGDVRGAKIAIGESGEVFGNVCAEDVEVRGKVNGSIRGRKVSLASKAIVDGDITHSQLAVEAGARVDGRVRFSADPLAPPDAPAALPAPKVSEPASTSTLPAGEAAGIFEPAAITTLPGSAETSGDTATAASVQGGAGQSMFRY
jgi:cytoskeletal protein CcmA (bactofilin family)